MHEDRIRPGPLDRTTAQRGPTGPTAFRLTLAEFTLRASAIPEPATCAVLFGLATFALAFLRKK